MQKENTISRVADLTTANITTTKTTTATAVDMIIPVVARLFNSAMAVVVFEAPPITTKTIIHHGAQCA